MIVMTATIIYNNFIGKMKTIISMKNKSDYFSPPLWKRLVPFLRTIWRAFATFSLKTCNNDTTMDKGSRRGDNLRFHTGYFLGLPI